VFGWAQLALAAALITYLVSDSLTNAPRLSLAVKVVGIVVMLGFWLFSGAEWEPRRR
jgi:hypothetical protein